MVDFDGSPDQQSRRRRESQLPRDGHGDERLILRGYHVMQTIGRGTTGIVYRAVQLSMQREVALKVLAPALARTAGFAERFIREARAAGAVHHPNVVTCYDVGEIDGVVYQALELMSGSDLSQLIASAGGHLPYKDAVGILIECARGLEGIHRAGLVHCDIRPSNIFITQEDIIKLADLGLARSLAQGEVLPVKHNMESGLATLAPEQISGRTVPDIRVDTYALGATLYIATTGSLPFSAKDREGLISQILTAPIPDPRDSNPELPEALSWVIAKALDKNPQERYTTPVQLREDLERLQFDFSPIHAKGRQPVRMVSSSQTADRRRSGTQGGPVQDPHHGEGSSAHEVDHEHGSSSTLIPALLIAAITCMVLIAGLITWQIASHSLPGSTPPAVGVSGSGRTLVSQRSDPLQPNAPDLAGSTSLAALSAHAQVHPIPSTPWNAPGWATRSGTDGYGRWIEVSVGLATQRFRRCPAGSFQMGSTADEAGRRDDETPYHVTITHAFWIADSEVTQQFYEAVTGTNPSAFKGAPLPVESISWHDAEHAIRQLNTLLPTAGLRLPSEAEWEYACRGGSSSLGATTRAQAWTAASSDNHTHPVKALSSNPWGLYDMLGNTMEWCQDCYGPYPSTSATDPLGWQGINRVARGGAWSEAEGSVRAAARAQYSASTRFFFLGIRLAASDVTDAPH